jgi:hypothetical protein
MVNGQHWRERAHQMSGRNEEPETLKLCPGCCTLEEIRRYEDNSGEALPMVGCTRYPFTFPVMPAEFAEMTYDAMRSHHCSGTYDGNWQELGDAIIGCMKEKSMNPAELARSLEGTWPQLPPGTCRY